MTDGPLLWYLNRSTGLVLLGLLTLSVVLGILATGGRAGRGLPRFAGQNLHRNVALLSVLFLAGHVATAVVDTYVDIRWWQALVPFGATYKPFWLELGAASLDLIAAVVLTSLLRTRLGHRSWRAVHLLAYLSWPLAAVHGVGIGTDMSRQLPWGLLVVAGCGGVVLLAATWRLGQLALTRSTMVGRPA
jgi:sulfoxide reductase heme-binding subunit YedZ